MRVRRRRTQEENTRQSERQVLGAKSKAARTDSPCGERHIGAGRSYAESDSKTRQLRRHKTSPHTPNLQVVSTNVDQCDYPRPVSLTSEHVAVASCACAEGKNCQWCVQCTLARIAAKTLASKKVKNMHLVERLCTQITLPERETTV